MPQKIGDPACVPSLVLQKNPENLLQFLCRRGELQEALEVLSHTHIPLSTTSYCSLLKICRLKRALVHARRVHAHILKHNVDVGSYLGGYLIVTLAKCGAIDDACHISSLLRERTVFSWTGIISAYSDAGCTQEALKMYGCMREDGISPSSFTFASLFKACGKSRDLEHGRKLHGDARNEGLASHIYVGNTIVSMYGKCGSCHEAEGTFVALSERDIVSWNVMLSVYVEQGKGIHALLLYRQMQDESHSPNQLTFTLILQACGIILDEQDYGLEEESPEVVILEITRVIHSNIRMMGFATNLVVSTALLGIYGRCGALAEAEGVFLSVSQHDIISWTAMLTSYVEQSQVEKALLLYALMQEEGMHPNSLTLVGALQACRNLAEKGGAVVKKDASKVMSLQIGHALHIDSCVDGHVSDAIVSTALINMYSTCGVIIEAHEVFLDLPQRDMVAWNAILTAYRDEEDGAKVLSLCGQMRTEKIPLDDITLVCILKACNEFGNVDLCRELHFEVASSKCEQINYVVSTLITSYAGCASLFDAESVFDGLCAPDIISWTACISGHAGEGNHSVSMNLFEKLKQEGNIPDDVTFTSILSACCHSGLLSRGLEFFESMRDYGFPCEVRHCSIIIDLLARAGDFKRVEKLLAWMQMQPDLDIWLSLLSACRIHNNLKLAEYAFNQAVSLQPKHPGSYFLMSNVYSACALFEIA